MKTLKFYPPTFNVSDPGANAAKLQLTMVRHWGYRLLVSLPVVLHEPFRDRFCRNDASDQAVSMLLCRPCFTPISARERFRDRSLRLSARLLRIRRAANDLG